MVEVTAGKAYSRPLPPRMSWDLLRYAKTELKENDLYWLATESQAKLGEAFSEAGKSMQGLIRGRYSRRNIIGTTRRPPNYPYRRMQGH